jgi:diguanylate cyclase (GGDEF)-like protein/PAS domain S-box-containing protein
MSFMLPFILQFIPFTLLFYMAIEIYLRNPRSFQHLLTMQLFLALSMLFLGEFFIHLLPEQYAEMASRYIKLLSSFFMMTYGMYFMKSFTAASRYSILSHAISLLPLTAVPLLVFAPATFGIKIVSAVGIWKMDEFSPPLQWLLMGMGIYAVTIFLIRLIMVYRRIHARDDLVLEKKRIRIVQFGAIATVVWAVLCQIVYPQFAIVDRGLPLGTVSSYGVLFLAWSIRYAMVNYEFLMSTGRRYERLFDLSPNGIALLDDRGRMVEANGAFLQMLGVEPDSRSWKNMPIMDYLVFDRNTDDRRRLRECFAFKERAFFEIVIRNRRLQSYTVEVDVDSFEMEGQIWTFVMAKDVTAQKESERKLEYLAYHDPLTGIGNRSRFYERLEDELKKPAKQDRMTAVLLIDLDQFKWINDTMGHSAGDGLLQAVAKRLLDGPLPEESSIARMGGDEFVILLPSIRSESEAKHYAAELIERFNAPFVLQERAFRITISMGISLAPRDGEDAESILRSADSAMYAAKKAGRNQYLMFKPTQQASAERALSLMNGLSTAMERGEFELHYQPQTELRTGRMIGVEALLRWRSAELGNVSPAAFIPIAEETGAIVPIGDWVLRSALTQGKRWLSEGHADLVISVNLSARQLREPGIAQRIAAILAEHDYPARNLCLEITESSAMVDPVDTLRVCQEIVALGITLAIDDFGTGYSSLSMISRFPFRIVKIDKSLVRDIGLSRKDAAVIRTIVKLSHHLEMRVLAEGVETEEQERMLRRFGCQESQGYLRGKPMPAEAIDRLLREEGQATAREGI